MNIFIEYCVVHSDYTFLMPFIRSVDNFQIVIYIVIELNVNIRCIITLLKETIIESISFNNYMGFTKKCV